MAVHACPFMCARSVFAARGMRPDYDVFATLSHSSSLQNLIVTVR
jgi:hypothetical protein